MPKRIAAIASLLAAAIIALGLMSGCARRYRGRIVAVDGEYGAVDDLGRVLPLSGATREAHSYMATSQRRF